MKLDKLLKQITPLPWRTKLGRFDFGNDGERYVVHSAPDHHHAQICIVAAQLARKRSTPYDTPDQERDAVAAYISHAANVLPELVEALKLLRAGASYLQAQGVRNPQLNGGMVLANAALARAEEVNL